MPYYRNRETGIIQSHPKSGIGDSLNSDEVAEDGKRIKPFVKMPITGEKIKRHKSLLKTAEANSGSGETKHKQEGDQ